MPLIYLKYLNLLNKILVSNFKRLRFPYKLTFSITNKCFFKCKSCGIWQKEAKNELSFDEIKLLFQRNNYFSWIDLTGGEPWMRNDFPDICEFILKECPHLMLLHFPTIGYFTEKIIDGLQRIINFGGNTKIIISISINGPPDVHDQFTGIAGSWEKAIETFKAVKKLKMIEVFFGYTISSFNATMVDKCYYALKDKIPDLNYSDIHLNLFHTSSHYYQNVNSEISIPEDSISLKAINKYREKRAYKIYPVDYLEKKYHELSEFYIKSGFSPLNCHALSSSIFIDAEGKVYPCTIYNKMLGNLRENSFNLNKVFNSSHTAEIHKEVFNLDCPNCWTPCEAYQSILGNMFNPYRIFKQKFRNNSKSKKSVKPFQ